MEPKFNLWLEKDGQVVLSAWRVSLLQAIEDSGSISAAAEKLGIPYRRAWQKVHEMEKRLGAALLETSVGGAGGGGARLTEAARHEIARFEQFGKGISEIVEEHFRATYGSP
ncbi:MAG: LysR family transcriptional regulator [Chloroflexi bacterium]|nr:LysR family transcriptional regulator [Chloroflexota bacterium]